MRISDWSSDVCSSDLRGRRRERAAAGGLDIEAASLCAGDRKALADRRLDPRRQPGPARHRLGPLCAQKLRTQLQGAGNGAQGAPQVDRKGVGKGKGVTGRVELGGGGIDKKKTK